jgi:hypothetical protein
MNAATGIYMRHQHEPPVIPPHNSRAVWSLPVATRTHPLVLAALSLAILVLDFLTGPHIHIAILFVFPVALATWTHGRRWGTAIAVILPLVRLPLLYFVWKVPTSWRLEAADTAIDLVVLLVLVQLIGYVARQRQEIQVLQGMLPICSFCKRIRDESGGWLQLERYIGERSEARFSHTFCPDCGRTHYRQYVD